MLDPRMTKLAELLVHYSCAMKKGETVFIEAVDIPHVFTQELIRIVTEGGGVPFVKIDSNNIKRALLIHGSVESWKKVAELECKAMSEAQCYIGIRGSENVNAFSDVPHEKQKLYETHVWKPVHQELRVKKTKWVVLRWPTPSMAQLAEQSTESFEDFFFHVCTLDYARMERAMQPLIELMNRTDRVEIRGPGKTNLTFSIKNIPAVGCGGHRNIPDGEVFTAPVKDSINGVIAFNTPSVYRGDTHFDVCFRFEKGKIVEATGSNPKRLNEILDTDEGARYIGEFAIGFNPYCTKPMKDILFDEKIAGSIHLTPGQCYEETENGNHSHIHWDLVLRQTEEIGGGEIWFDGVLIRKNGIFLLPELQGLNPEKLM